MTCIIHAASMKKMGPTKRPAAAFPVLRVRSSATLPPKPAKPSFNNLVHPLWDSLPIDIDSPSPPAIEDGTQQMSPALSMPSCTHQHEQGEDHVVQQMPPVLSMAIHGQHQENVDVRPQVAPALSMPSSSQPHRGNADVGPQVAPVAALSEEMFNLIWEGGTQRNSPVVSLPPSLQQIEDGTQPLSPAVPSSMPSCLCEQGTDGTQQQMSPVASMPSCLQQQRDSGSQASAPASIGAVQDSASPDRLLAIMEEPEGAPYESPEAKRRRLFEEEWKDRSPSTPRDTGEEMDLADMSPHLQEQYLNSLLK